PRARGSPRPPRHWTGASPGRARESSRRPYYTPLVTSLRAATGLLVVLVILLGPSPAPAAPRVLVALGDSLTAGLGVAPDEAYPAVLEARLREAGFDYRVVNAGISGDTSAGGLRRLDWVLRSRPDVAIVALAAHHGLRA